MSEPAAAEIADRPEQYEDAAVLLYRRFRRGADDKGERRFTRPATGSSLAQNPRSTARVAAQEATPQKSLREVKPLGPVMEDLIASRGWQAPVAVGSVISRWPQLVGESIAEHCTPTSFDNGVVVVACDSTAWATNLKLMRSSLMDVFDTELGRGIVTELDIRGPSAPSWKRGKFSVRGRGPRDTYG